ncbi:MAG: outer membrane protein assembly factor BamC, partial [Gammaproteobacteria bacterium]|nr:outer membrane protein assembly factor BamC [Gammaproteobacteria bacterium]
MRVLWPLLLTLLAVSGCSWLTGDKGYFRDRSDDYRKAQVEPPLQVPAGLDAGALQEIYVIPPITEDIRVTGEFEAPRPAPLVAGATDELVRIQKLGSEEWMLASISPGQLWPQVRGFLGAGSMPVARVDARAGLIETGWLAGEDGGMSERYRFRIEQGVQRNTAELHVLQMYQAGDINSWPEASANLENEHDVLREVAQYIANNVETATVSMMAQQAISATGKVSMQEDSDGKPMIRLELPYNRAWASMERALRASNFEILDKDRSTGSYFVHYVRPVDKQAGWLDWLFDNDEDD